jgi:hypothetical protein
VSRGNCNLQASNCLGEIDMDREFSARFRSNQTMLVSARSDQRPGRRFGAASSVQAHDGSGSGGACAEARQGRQDQSIGTAIRQARVQVIGNVVQVIGNVVRRSADHGKVCKKRADPVQLGASSRPCGRELRSIAGTRCARCSGWYSGQAWPHVWCLVS